MSQLGTPALSWRRLDVLIRMLPPDCALKRVPDDHLGWGLAEHLLALVADGINAGNWQRGGGKGPKPKPIPRPGVEESTVTTEAKTIGTSRPVEEVRSIFDAMRRRALEGAVSDGD